MLISSRSLCLKTDSVHDQMQITITLIKLLIQSKEEEKTKIEIKFELKAIGMVMGKLIEINTINIKN